MATAAEATTTDPKAYYGYLFEVDKKPTKTLDALLKGIAEYIVSCFATTRGEKEEEAG